MPYIGRDTDKISNVEVLDNITFDGSSSYTLQKGGSNFTPSSANTLLVSIDGVVQAGNFTVSGSTIDFGVAVPSTSTCDFILHYGTGLITTVSDGTVTTAKLGNASVTSAKLGSDVTQGITEADQWRLTADKTSNGDFTSNLERVDETSFGGIGTGMTESSGIFSFPQTGIYLIRFNSMGYAIPSDNVYISILVTTNNSTYNEFSLTGEGSSNTQFTCSTEAMVDVTDISNVKVKFNVSSINAGSSIAGNTNSNYTSFTFIRLGDT